MPNRIRGVSGGQALLAAASDASPLPTFSGIAYTGGPMRVWHYRDPVVIDLAGLVVSSDKLPVLFQHRDDDIVGHLDVVNKDQGRISISGVISGVGDAAKEVVSTSKNGYPWQLSVGADPLNIEEIRSGEKVTVNGRSLVGPLTVVRTSMLREISFVTLGADPATTGSVNAGAFMTFEQWLESLGLDKSKISEAGLKTLQEAYAALYPSEDPPEEEEEEEEEDPVAARRRAELDEYRRVAAIRASTKRWGDPTITVGEGQAAQLMPVSVHAISAGLTPDQAELLALRASRPTPTIPGSGSPTSEHERAAVEASVMLRCGVAIDSSAFSSPVALRFGLPTWLRASVNADVRQRAMEHAHRLSDTLAVDLCRIACRLDGVTPPEGRREMIRAAMSGGNLANIFTTSVNAKLMQAFMEELDTTVGWTQESEVADFKTNERVSVDEPDDLVLLPTGAEADHMSFSDKKESFKISRFAKQFVVDEQDFLNDSLQALRDTPDRLGRAARRLRPNLVYAILLANANLNATGLPIFSDSNATDNSLSGALSSASLRTAVATLGLIKENGVSLGQMPTHLLVGPSNRHLAYELTQSSQILIRGSTDAERGVLNALAADGITPVSEARLENGVTDPVTGTVRAGSATAYYVANGKGRTVEVAYLRGTGKVPQVRSFVLNQGRWGLGWDVSYDIGAKAIDWKSLVKSA